MINRKCPFRLYWSRPDSTKCMIHQCFKIFRMCLCCLIQLHLIFDKFVKISKWSNWSTGIPRCWGTSMLVVSQVGVFGIETVFRSWWKIPRSWWSFLPRGLTSYSNSVRLIPWHYFWVSWCSTVSIIIAMKNLYNVFIQYSRHSI